MRDTDAEIAFVKAKAEFDQRRAFRNERRDLSPAIAQDAEFAQ